MPEFTPKKYKFTATTIRIEASRLDLIDKIALKYNISGMNFLTNAYILLYYICVMIQKRNILFLKSLFDCFLYKRKANLYSLFYG